MDFVKHAVLTVNGTIGRVADASEFRGAVTIDGSKGTTTDWYAQSVLFQISAIADNNRGPRYAEAVLNSLHEVNRRRQPVCLEFGSHQGTVGLFVRVPTRLVTTFTHDFADAYPGCTLTALPDEVRDSKAGHVWSATLRLSPDVFSLKTHRQFEDLLHRELTDPLAGLLSALRAKSKSGVDPTGHSWCVLARSGSPALWRHPRA